MQIDTPKFYLDENKIKRQVDLLQIVLNTYFLKNRIAYSVKTNYEVVKLAVCKDSNLDFEVVSLSEYDYIQTLKYSGQKIIVNGPNKPLELLRRTEQENIVMNLETWSQVDDAIHLRLPQVGIRIKCDRESRFGFEINNGEVSRVVEHLGNAGIRVCGLHHHGGSDISSVEQRKKWASNLGYLFNSIRDNKLVRIKYIDVGGGFPSSRYKKRRFGMGRQNGDISAHIKAIFEGLSLKMDKNALKDIEIMVEPGRYLVEDAGYYITKVIDVKKTGGQINVIVDGAITQLPLTYYRPQTVSLYDNKWQRRSGSTQKIVIYGSTCKEDDVLWRGNGPSLMRGDYVVFEGVGAYNQSMGSSFILGKI